LSIDDQQQFIFFFKKFIDVNESLDGYQISVDQYRKLFSAIEIAGARGERQGATVCRTKCNIVAMVLNFLNFAIKALVHCS